MSPDSSPDSPEGSPVPSVPDEHRIGGFDDGEQLELTELLNTALDKGVALRGDITLAVAEIDLVKLHLGLLLSAFETIDRGRGDPKTGESILGGSDRPSLANVLGPLTLGEPAARVPESRAPVPMSGDVVAVPEPDASLNAVAQGLPERINTDASGVESGLARLVLTLIEVLRKVLEHQAVRRMDGGKLSTQEIERLGLALSRLNDRMQDLKRVFGLADEDLQIDLGPLGRLR